MEPLCGHVIPAQAGIQVLGRETRQTFKWIPASAGMTNKGGGDEGAQRLRDLGFVEFLGGGIYRLR